MKLEKLNLNVINHSSNKKNLKMLIFILVDTFGETKKFHKIASSVFLGGSISDKNWWTKPFRGSKIWF